MPLTEPSATAHAPVHNLIKKTDGLDELGIMGNFPVDKAVLKVLPKGTKVVSATSWGTSAWTITGRMETILADGTPKTYFLKCAADDLGKSMVLGEFTAISEILKVIPDMAPTAYAWGKYESDHQNSTYFLLSDFLEMDTHDRTLPDPDEFCSKIAELHLKGLSPNGKFGFPVTTYHGRFSHFCDRWDESWSTFMANLITNLLVFDQVNNGDWPELIAVGQHCVTHVIPRLLGVLQSDGRSIQPCLIHGDLWEGNIGTEIETGNIVVYDAGSFFAHHEFELGHWRCERHRISSKLFRKTYLKYYPASDPVEEFDDRNRLYSLPSNIMYATQAPGAIERMVAYNDLCYLCEKYAPKEGLGKYDKAKDPTIAMWR